MDRYRNRGTAPPEVVQWRKRADDIQKQLDRLESVVLVVLVVLATNVGDASTCPGHRVFLCASRFKK
jgi:hypothetical protein